MGRRNQFLPQPLIGSMQAHGQGELGPAQARQSLFRQGGQGAGHTHGAHRDLALGHAQIGAQAIDGLQHRLDVEQGLAHAHEHHMAGALLHHGAHAQHLIHDLVHRQGALQSPFTGGTELAGHRASHLAADTDGEPITGRDADGLKAEAVVRPQQQLGGAVAGHAAVQLAGATQPIEGSSGRLGGQLLAEGLGEHRHLLEAAGPFGVEPIVQLPAAKGRLAAILHPLLQSRKAHPQQGTGLGCHSRRNN